MTPALFIFIPNQVLERTKKQQEMERELTERMIQLNDQMTTQLATYEKDRRQFDEDRALWEAENREALSSLPHARDPSYVLWTSKPVASRKRLSKSPLLTWIRAKPTWLSVHTGRDGAAQIVPVRSTSVPLASINGNSTARGPREKSPTRPDRSITRGHCSRFGMRSVVFRTSRTTSTNDIGWNRSSHRSGHVNRSHGHSNTSSLDRFIEKSRLWAARAPLARMEHTHVTSPCPCRSTGSVLCNSARGKEKQLIRSSMDKLDKTRSKRKGLF
ncbi:hypothetical protein FGIG_07224 [Fasciola gigantica]|uniref:Uncharacterized protein n=1 Tax=Fasciola gigantica TaxID=46835 RepID=A0A504ZC29_FASGI|nr:hypothetical protein FGIG_07224 [Fasciola gigantica]